MDNRPTKTNGGADGSFWFDLFHEECRKALAQRIRAIAFATVDPAHVDEVSETVFQETSLRFLPQTGSRQTLEFAVGIARNVFREEFRQRKRILLFDDEICESIAETISVRPFELISREIMHCIEGLSHEQQVAVRRRYFEEHSVTDIAQEENCTPAAISGRLNLAYRKLRQCLARRGVTQQDVR